MSEGDLQPPTMKVVEAHNIGQLKCLVLTAIADLSPLKKPTKSLSHCLSRLGSMIDDATVLTLLQQAPV